MTSNGQAKFGVTFEPATPRAGWWMKVTRGSGKGWTKWLSDDELVMVPGTAAKVVAPVTTTRRKRTKASA
jgi:hypothetical protein